MKSTIAAALAALMLVAGYAATGQQVPIQRGQALTPRLQAVRTMNAYRQATIKRTEGLKRMDMSLDRQMVEMDLATGPRKMQALVRVVQTLVAQRKAMRSMIFAMNGQMLRLMQRDSSRGKAALKTPQSKASHL